MSKLGVKNKKLSFNGDPEVMPHHQSLNKLMIGISFLPMTQDAGKLLDIHFLFFPSWIIFMFFQNNSLY